MPCHALHPPGHPTSVDPLCPPIPTKSLPSSPCSWSNAWRIQLHDHDDSILLLEGVMEEDYALVVQLREDVQLPPR